MHSYSIAGKERMKVIVAIVGISIPTALLATSWVIQPIVSKYPILDGFISPIGWAVVFTFLFALYDNWVWKWRWLTKIPDLNGVWIGPLETSFKIDGQPIEIEAQLSIKQTYMGIEVCGKFTNKNTASVSKSISKVAGIMEESQTPVLSYAYNNQADIFADKDVSDHRGYAEFNLNREEQTLEGTYCTFKRQTFGKMKLKKK